MKVKTSDLKDSALDYAVAIAEGIPAKELRLPDWKGDGLYRYTKDEDGNLDGCYQTGPRLLFSSMWEAGGPIIEREGLWVREYALISPTLTQLIPKDKKWTALASRDYEGGTKDCHYGPTFLIAAMRCYVASKLGDEVTIPKKLL